MKIAFISHNRIGLNMGGLQRQITKTMESLEKLGHEVVLWNSWDGVRHGEFQIAHLFSADHTLLAVHEAFAERGIPTVLSPVLGASHRSKPMLRMRAAFAASSLPVYQDLARVLALVRRADAVIALHEREKDLCRLYGRTGPIDLVPNGVAEVFRAGSPQGGRRRVAEGRYYLQVAQFWPNKGQDWLIENWDERDGRLVLVGEAPTGQETYYASCRRAAEGRSVTFLGAIEPDSQELADLYSGAKALLLNSRSEVAPIVINEAMAAGTHVVMPEHLASDPSTSPDATFERGDAASFRAALASLQGSETRQRWVPSWDDVAASLTGIYEGLRS